MHRNRITYRDTIAYRYARKVVDREIVAGKYIILECERFLYDLERQDDENFEWKFDLKIYNFILSFQNLFKFADGVKSGSKLELADFQIWILACLFCWTHKEQGYVRFSKAYIQVARKNGKSFILGFVVLIKSLLENYGQFFVVATKRDQAAIVVREVKKLLDLSDKAIKDRFKVYGKANINKIICDATLSEIAPLSADSNTLDGLGVDLAVVDEFGAHPNYELYEVMRSSQTYKLNSQIVIITTSYPNTQTSPAYTERCLLIDAYEGKTEMDDRYFSAIYELDEDDDYNDVGCWGKSNPLFVQYPDIMKKLISDFESAKKEPEKLQLFLTKNLNCWLTSDSLTSYLDFNEWKKCEVDNVSFRGREVIVGVDMSKSTDLCGVSILAKDEYTGEILLKSKAFLPKDVVQQKEISDKLAYNAYIQHHPEWITATEGKYVNQVEVEEYIRNIESNYGCRIRAISFDSWGSLHLMSSLSRDYEVIDTKMSYKLFSPTLKRFREVVYDGLLKHEYNPILNFCAANAVTKTDLSENILLDKKKSVNRIDLLVASVIAYSEVVDDETNEQYGDYCVI
ncbi:terminase large subunit [Terrisporobacter sp.]|uniref:terminase large subunit n=1 Tax=Terrisporobacter sp. TaxID=1965305 RepID=UPI003991085B